MTTVDISDLVVLEVTTANSFKQYLKQVWLTITRQSITHTFDRLEIDKADARKIYRRAYPKAKV